MYLMCNWDTWPLLCIIIDLYFTKVYVPIYITFSILLCKTTTWYMYHLRSFCLCVTSLPVDGFENTSNCVFVLRLDFITLLFRNSIFRTTTQHKYFFLDFYPLWSYEHRVDRIAVLRSRWNRSSKSYVHSKLSMGTDSPKSQANVIENKLTHQLHSLKS